MAHRSSARSVRAWLAALVEGAGVRSRKQRRASWPLTLERLEPRTVPTVTTVPQTYTTNPNVPTSLAVLQADGIATGGPLSLVSTSSVSPSGPTLTQNADGSLTFTSATTGTYTFTHTVAAPGGLAGQQEIIPTDSPQGYGNSLAVSGNTAVVGAPLSTVGNVSGQGKVYIYTLSGTTWSLQQEFTGADAGSNDFFFGVSVALDGNTAVIGSNHDAAYVYTSNGTTWSLQQELKPADSTIGDSYGSSVAIKGSTIAVGSEFHSSGGVSDQGSVYVYTQSGTTWSQQTELTPPDGVMGDRFASIGALAIDGNTIVVGSDQGYGAGDWSNGAAYIYTGAGASWSLQQELKAADGNLSGGFGQSVAISGDTVVIGSPGWTPASGPAPHGAAYVYTRSATTWSLQQEFNAAPQQLTAFGNSVAIDGDTMIVGDPRSTVAGQGNQGAAFVFTRSNSTWTQLNVITAADGQQGDQLASDVALSGDNAVVGAGKTAAYFQIARATATITVNVAADDVLPTAKVTFTTTPNTPTTLDVLPNDINPQETGLQVISSTPISPAGPALTQNPDGTFTFSSNSTGTYSFNYTFSGAQQEVTASDSAANDEFGWSVAVSGNTAVIGANGHTVGRNINQGAAYVFTLVGSVWTFQQELTAADGVAGSYFGESVAISGNDIVVGAPDPGNAGALGVGVAYVYTFGGTTWTQQQELTASDGAAGDLFGISVTVSGDTLVVGAPLHKVGNNAGQGAAYVYTLSGTTWTPTQELTSANGLASDGFGDSVAISGNTLVVGDSFAGTAKHGAAYVFALSGSLWSQQQELTAADGAANDHFGESVAVSGNTIVVGASNHAGTGAAYVYTFASTSWSLLQELNSPNGGVEFGRAVALSGNTMVVGDGAANQGQGEAYVFTLAGSIWVPRQNLTAADGVGTPFFGGAVAVYGDTAVVSALNQIVSDNVGQGAVYIQNVSTASALITVISGNYAAAAPQTFTTAPNVPTTLEVLQADGTANGGPVSLGSVGPVSPSGPTLTTNADGSLTFTSASSGTYTFTQTVTGAGAVVAQQELTPLGSPHVFGSAMAVSGNTAVVGDYGINMTQGAIYVYTLTGTTWGLQQEITAPDGAQNDGFGKSVAIDGNTLVAGTDYPKQSAYIYTRSGATWSLQQELKGPNGGRFSSSVAISGKTLAVGAVDDGTSGQGAVYVYAQTGTTWSLQTELTPPDGTNGDQYGSIGALAIDGNTLVVGADQAAQGNGAVYVYAGPSWSLQQEIQAADGVLGGGFGQSVSVSGNTIAIGSPGWVAVQNGPTPRGAAYVFTRSGTTWSLQQEFNVAPLQLTSFAWSVAIDGDTMLIGDPARTVGGQGNEGAVSVFTRSNSTWTQQSLLTAADGQTTDGFGFTVALSSGNVVICDDSGRKLAVYFNESTQATITVNVVSPGLTASPDSYTIAPNTPTKLNVLANDTNPQGSGLQIISSTPVSPSGPTLTQNADGTFTFNSTANGTYTFNYTATGVQEELTASDGAASDNFGDSVAVSGNTAVVGAAGHTVGSNSTQGAAYVFALVGSAWTFKQELTAADGTAGSDFGTSVAISGDTIVIGATEVDGTGPGAAYVYTLAGTTWTPQGELTPADGAGGDAFGSSVAVSGDTIIVGAPGHQVGHNAGQGAAYVYKLSGTTWTPQQELTAANGAAGDGLGASVAVSANTVVVGAFFGGNLSQGVVYVYTVSGSLWSEQQELSAADGAAFDEFGQSVAISGSTIVVGAGDHNVGNNSSQGAAYVYTLSGTTWSQQQELTADDGGEFDFFGDSVAVSGNVLVVGAAEHNVGNNVGQGAAYVYSLNGSAWTLQRELTADDGVSFGLFGDSVALSGDTVVVGAESQLVGNNATGTAYIQNESTSSALVTVTVTTQHNGVNISSIGGGGQSAAAGNSFANPLIVSVTDGTGHPISGVTVTFAGPTSGAGVSFPDGNTAVTNAQGQASVSVTANAIGGTYTVTASVAGVATPASFVLTNLVAPLVTTQPVDQLAAVGGSATFTAAASGSPTPTVQWEVSTNGGSTFGPISNATMNPLVLSDVTPAMNGYEYEAVFTNVAGSATSNAATLTVPFAPSIVAGPNSKAVISGASVTFAATANGSPTPTVQWDVSTDGGSTYTQISGATATSLTLSSVAQSMNGYEYEAVFTNSLGSATTNAAVLTVATPPAILTQPRAQTHLPGETVLFTASASGTPTPTVQWEVSVNQGATFISIPGAT